MSFPRSQVHFPCLSLLHSKGPSFASATCFLRGYTDTQAVWFHIPHSPSLSNTATLVYKKMLISIQKVSSWSCIFSNENVQLLAVLRQEWRLMVCKYHNSSEGLGVPAGESAPEAVPSHLGSKRPSPRRQSLSEGHTHSPSHTSQRVLDQPLLSGQLRPGEERAEAQARLLPPADLSLGLLLPQCAECSQPAASSMCDDHMV